MKKLLIATTALSILGAPAIAEANLMDMNPDEMTIEQLNEWQLAQLGTPQPRERTVTTVSSDVTGPAYAQSVTTYETQADVKTDATASDDKLTYAKPDEAKTMSTEMGGIEYATREDADAAYAIVTAIPKVTMDDPRFTTLSALMNKTELDEVLSEEGPYTVFAPTNAAFEKLPDDLKTELMSDSGKDELTKILKAHVLEGKVKTSDISTMGEAFDTIGQTVLTLEAQNDGSMKASNVAIIAGDIEAGNGVIHVIDDVIVPEWVTDPGADRYDVYQ